MTDELLLTAEEMSQAIIADPDIPMGQAVAKAQLAKAKPIIDKEWQERLRQEILGNEVAQLASIKEAKREERERIIDFLQKHKVRTGAQKGWHISFSETTWQALKAGE